MKRITKGALSLIAAALLILSCSSPDGTVVPSKTIELSKAQQESIKETFRGLSKIAVYNHKAEKFVVLEPTMEKMGFSFADPDPDWNFGSSDNITFTQTSAGDQVIFVGSDLGSANGQGGVVTAGSSALPIDYTFCYSVDSETAFSIDAGSVPFDGVSGVLGFSGDLQGLQDADLSVESVFDYYKGYAYYWVYADEANGSYEILDWLEFNSDPFDVQDRGFSFVFDFEQGNAFWSSEGQLQVSGGQMNFEGEYFAWIDFLDLFFSGDDYNGSLEYVDGYGAMGCD